MKISIGINGYKSYNELKKREQLCIDSLVKLKQKYDNITLFNICYKDDNVNYNNFNTIDSLTIKSNELISSYYTKNTLPDNAPFNAEQIKNNQKILPSVKEIFNKLSETDCDYFIFLNNDIILSDRAINTISTDYESYTVSRLDIEPIESLSEQGIPLEYCLHGFDCFIIKKQTWLEIRHLFDDFILGRFYWDTYTATMLNLFCKCKNLNKLPPVCFHIKHENVSAAQTIENYYAEQMFQKNQILPHLWFNYVYNVLFKRASNGNCKWFYPLPNEEKIEKNYFGQFDIDTALTKNDWQPLKITKNKDYDVFIPVAPKDENKLQFVIQGVLENLTPKNIFICSPHNIQSKITDTNITYINDNDIVDIQDKKFIGFRPNWTYQQFLKMFFKSESEYYFAIDSDTIILDNISLFKENKPIWYYGDDQKHIPYFLFNKKIFNLSKTIAHTGIGDVGLFNKKITESFLSKLGFENCKDLLEFIGPKINNIFHFSEYETYANFVNEFYPGHYLFNKLNKETHGKNVDNGENWTSLEVESAIKAAKINKKQILTLHSWKI